jgi:two-component system chemotaxis response regulator CheY
MVNRSKRIAIVDDAPFIREILRNIAQTQGWTVVGEAETGVEAIELAAKVQPQLILMDLVMPEMNGIDATKKILALNPKIKIIACSTIDQENILLRAIENGCCSYLTKPFKKDDVIRAVNQAFELNREVS